MSGIQLGFAGNVSLCCDIGLVGNYPKYVPKYSKYVTICCCHGCCCWRHLCLHSQDNDAKDSGCGNRQDRCVDKRGGEEVGHRNPIGVEQQKQKQNHNRNKINNSGGNVTTSAPADSYPRAATAAASE
jgi:hypothetical protein